MDLSTSSSHVQKSGFPRPRGDGPKAFGKRAAPAMVSPPTRGWTLPSTVIASGDSGFPAHAGMDLELSYRDPRRSRFPRPRGDGPARYLRLLRIDEVSPPTRGWTVGRHDRADYCHGFPAHAGMDRLRPRRRAAIARFPRPRGDGPRSTRRTTTTESVSPPTRGWTVSGEHARLSRTGFPAHAGMDP